MMDSVNSTTFIKRPPCMTDSQEKFLYTKELLSGRIFLGCYQERRYVSALKEYRDVVIVNSEETDLQNDIDKLRQKWLGVDNIKWMGITGPDAVDLPKTYCFWVKLTNLAFGHYWFQIKYVKLVEGEILFHLKCIRGNFLTYYREEKEEFQMPTLVLIFWAAVPIFISYYCPMKFQSFHPAHGTCVNEKSKPQHKNEKTKQSASFNGINWEFPKGAISSIAKGCDDAIHIIMPYLTWVNFAKTIKVSCALTIAFFMAIVTLVGHLGEFILKLIRELSLLVNAFTPIIIHLIDFFSKIFGGFFILLAGLFGRNTYRLNMEPHKSNDFYSTNVTQTPAIDWRKRNQILRKELLSNEFRR